MTIFIVSIIAIAYLYYSTNDDKHSKKLRILISLYLIIGIGLLSWESHVNMMITKSMYSIGTHTEFIQQSHIGLRMESEDWFLNVR